MPTRGQLRRAKPTSVDIDLGEGDIVKVVFDRNKVTDAWMGEWSRLEEEKDLALLNEALADLIISWDVTEEDGSSFAATSEHIGEVLAVPDKRAFLEAMLTASIPSRAEKNVSSSQPSTPPPASEQPPQTPQNGPALSTSPSFSESPSPM